MRCKDERTADVVLPVTACDDPVSSSSLPALEAATAQLLMAHSAASSSDSRMVASFDAFFWRGRRGGAAPMEKRVPGADFPPPQPGLATVLAVLPIQHSVIRGLLLS